MYKEHFRKWDLRKRLSYTVVEQLTKQDMGQNLRKSVAENRKIESYIRRLPPEKRSRLQSARKAAPAAPSQPEPDPSASSLKFVLVAAEACRSDSRYCPKAPDSLRQPENLMKMMRSFVSLLVEPQIPEGEGQPIRNEISKNGRWLNLLEAAIYLVSQGYMDYGFNVIQFCFDRCRFFLQSTHPSTMPRLCQSLLRLYRTHPDLFKLTLRYLRRLSAMFLPVGHSTRQVIDQLSSLEYSSLGPLEECLMRIYKDYAYNRRCNHAAASRPQLETWSWNKGDDRDPTVNKVTAVLEEDPELWFSGIVMYPLRPEFTKLGPLLESLSSEQWERFYGTCADGILVQAAAQYSVLVEQGHSLETIATIQGLLLCELLMNRIDSSTSLDRIAREFGLRLDQMCSGFTSTEARRYQRDVHIYTCQAILSSRR